MFTHIMVGSNDTEKAAAFYNAALGALGVSPAQGERLFYMHKGGAFGVGKPRNGEAATCLLYTSPSPRDQRGSRMPSSA